MPYTDHEKKLDRMRDWRRERTPAYHRWLYAKRKLHIETASVFETSLLLIGRTNINAKIEAEKALTWADRRREVGNRFDHEQDQPYFKED